MPRNKWPEDVRVHLAIVSVGNSTLRSQSGKGCNERARNFLRDEMKLSGLSELDEKSFFAFLDQKTVQLAALLPLPDSSGPNWGAARKVISIYFRLCAMNKDVNSEFDLSSIEPFLEVPLDSEVIKGIDKQEGTAHAKTFRIRTLTPFRNTEFQALAKRIAVQKGLHRYELDVLYWNRLSDA